MLLPPDWRKWDAAKLAAIVAHERSHVRRRDPVVQFVSAIHRSLLWVSPFSWFLHRSIIRTAEEVSDDDAVAVICDRVSYAEILLEFTQRRLCQRKWMVVQMARYDRPEKRIRRVLNSASGARRITRWGVTAVLAIASPLAYVVAAAHPQVSSQPTPLPVPVAAASTLAPQQPAAAEPSPGPKPTPVQAAPPAAPSQEKPPSSMLPPSSRSNPTR
jgi:beta-lactamase regulating signal transducer with metallopeptidase domain